jgi:hypothetical protein
MCPACVTTLALIAGGVTSTGAIGSLIAIRRSEHRRDAWRSESEARRAEKDPWHTERELPGNEEDLAR